jgi:hypothetical protein
LEALEDRTVPSAVLVQAFNVTGGTPTAADNDYTRVNNAVQAAASGDTITLQGNFDWTESHAAASWAANNYGVTAPTNLDGVTLTAAAPGSAQITGPGSTPGVALTGVFFFQDGPDTNWTISNLRLVNFDFAIGFSTSTPGSFDGTKILNNFIHVATPPNATVDPAYSVENLGINFSFGMHQTIQGNTVETDGDGVSNSAAGAFSTVVGIECDTSAPGAYDGLLIDGNTVRVLRAQSADPEKIAGIWENTHDFAANITVSNNQFVNLAAGNNPVLNRQTAFQLTTGSSATTTVAYVNNTVSGANTGFRYIAGFDFSAEQAARLWQNTVTNTDVGVLVRSKGSVNLWQNNITGSHTAGVMVTDGGRLEPSGSVANAVQENFIRNGGSGIVVQSDAGAVGAVFDNDLSGNTGFAVNNQVGGVTVDAVANWWGSAQAAFVAGKVSGLVNFTPFLLFGTDTQPAVPGFQGDFRGGIQFLGQPGNTTAGQVLSPPVTVQILDIFGNPLTTGSSVVSLALSPAASLGGTTKRASAGGAATFNDLVVTKAGTYRLTATVPGLPAALSQPFTVGAAAASRLVFVTQPATITAGGLLPPIVVQLVDQFGNPAARAGVAVTLNISSGVLFGTRTLTTNAQGRVVFTNLRVFSTGTFFLTATAGGFATGFSQAFVVLPLVSAQRRRWL